MRPAGCALLIRAWTASGLPIRPRARISSRTTPSSFSSSIPTTSGLATPSALPPPHGGRGASPIGQPCPAARPAPLQRAAGVDPVARLRQQVRQQVEHRLRVDAAQRDPVLSAHAARLGDAALHLNDPDDDSEEL